MKAEAATTAAVTESSTHAEAAVQTSAPLLPEEILSNPETWIVVAFVLFIAVFLRYLAPKIGQGLDARADKIREQLEQASRLRAEAEALLASYQLAQEKLLKEAESIIETAKRDAITLRVHAAEELKIALDRRSQQAQEKIARAEAEAVSAIRSRIIETATERARGILAERGQSQSEAQTVDRALAAIAQQVH